MTGDQQNSFQPEHSEQPKHYKAAVFALLGGFFMVSLDATIVNIALPKLAATFHITAGTALWINSSYLLAFVAPILVSSRFGDKYGAHRLFMLGMAIFTLGSALCSVATTFNQLIVARVIQGLGAGIQVAQPLPIIAQIVPLRKRTEIIGYWGATAGFALALAPLIGGLLVDSYHWSAIFLINVPIGILTLLCLWKFLPEIPHNLELKVGSGALLSAAAITLIAFGLQEGPTYNWGSVVSWVSIPLILFSGVVLLMMFIRTQFLQGQEALLPLKLFKNRSWSLGALAIFTFSFSNTTLSIPLILVLHDSYMLTTTQTAFALMPMAVVSGIGGILTGKLAARVGEEKIVLLGVITYIITLTLLCAALVMKAELLTLIVLTVAAAVGGSLAFTPLAAIVTKQAPADQRGASSGAANVLRQLGGLIGVALTGLILASKVSISQADASYSIAIPGAVVLITLMSAVFLILDCHKK